MQNAYFRIRVLPRTTSVTGRMTSSPTVRPSRSACSFSMAIRARAAPSYRTVVRAGLTISHTGVSSNPATEISSGTAIPFPRRKLIRSMA